MHSPEDLRWEIALSLVPRIGPRTFLKLLHRYGSAADVFASGILNQAPDFKEVDRILAFARFYALDIWSILDPAYPFRLKDCPDPPSILYYKGSIDPNQPRVLSIIGTRRPSTQGRGVVREFLETLSQYGILVVSGLADGIDGLAHRYSLENELPTIGVLAHGLQTIYPVDHRILAKQMVKNGGLLTEYPPGTPAKKEYFPIRNRIIAGMADAVLVIESNPTGGSLITAKLASSYNRELFAVPGRTSDLQSQGCHELIRTNLAQLVTSGKEMATDMNWRPLSAGQIRKTRLNAMETLLLSCLSKNEPRSIDVLQAKTGLALPDLTATLLSLELTQSIEALPGKRYRAL